jgi:hypothetical protein
MRQGGVIRGVVGLIDNSVVCLLGCFVDRFDKVVKRMFLSVLGNVVESSVTCCVHVEVYFSSFWSFSFVLITEVVGGVVFGASTVKAYRSVRVVHFRVDMEVVTEADSMGQSVMLELSLVVAVFDSPLGSVDWRVDAIDFLSSFDQA